MNRTKEEAKRASLRRAGQAEAQYNKVPGSPDFESKEILQAIKDNEHGEANILKKAMKGKFCLDYRQKLFFRFDGGYWREDIEGESLQYAHDTIYGLYMAERDRQYALAKDTTAESKATTPEAGEAAKKAREKAEAKAQEIEQRLRALNTLRRTNNILTLATKGKNGLTMDGEQWNMDPWSLQAGENIIQLRDGKARAGSPADYINKAAPTEWKGLAEPCPNWCNFMESIFDGDKALVDYMQKVLGAALIGKPITREFYILVGEGSNGKSTLFETLKEVLGDDLAGPIKSDVIMDDNRNAGKSDPEKLELKGKRIIWVNETKRNEKLDTEQVKAFTGGDTIVGRYNYDNKIMRFAPTHTLFLLTNNKPRITGGGTAIWDRLRIIEFKTRFVENPNPNLGEKPRVIGLQAELLKEKSGILAWLVQGCLDYLRDGAKAPETVMQNCDDYRLDQDTILDFMREKCVLGKDQYGNEYKTQAKPLYDAYKEWYEDKYGDDTEPVKQRSFARDLKERAGIRYTKGHFAYYHGIGLLEATTRNDYKDYHDYEEF